MFLLFFWVLVILLFSHSLFLVPLSLLPLRQLYILSLSHPFSLFNKFKPLSCEKECLKRHIFSENRFHHISASIQPHIFLLQRIVGVFENILGTQTRIPGIVPPYTGTLHEAAFHDLHFHDFMSGLYSRTFSLFTQQLSWICHFFHHQFNVINIHKRKNNCYDVIIMFCFDLLLKNICRFHHFCSN